MAFTSTVPGSTSQASVRVPVETNLLRLPICSLPRPGDHVTCYHASERVTGSANWPYLSGPAIRAKPARQIFHTTIIQLYSTGEPGTTGWTKLGTPSQWSSDV